MSRRWLTFDSWLAERDLRGVDLDDEEMENLRAEFEAGIELGEEMRAERDREMREATGR